MFRFSIRPAWAVLLLGLLNLQGCQTLQSNEGLLEQESPNSKVSSRQLRIVLDDIVLQYSSQVERAADQILADNNDPHVCKNALLWKMNGISSCFQAASRRDPLGSFFDIWILNKQTLALFEHPDNGSLFGESQNTALDATKQIETVMADVLNLIGDGMPVNEEFATRFASDHPITDLYFKRASMTANYTKYMDSIDIKGPELFGVVGDLDQQLDQFQRLSSMYAEFLPKQARWNGELMILETLESNAITSSLQNLSLAANGMVTIAKTTQEIPELIERERNLLHDAITNERIATMRAVDQMRSDTLANLQNERIAVLNQVESERAIILEAIEKQRVAATGDLANLGEESLEKIDQIVDSKIANIAVRGNELIDHGFQRLMQFTAALAAVALLSFVSYRLISRKRAMGRMNHQQEQNLVEFQSAGTEANQNSLRPAKRAETLPQQKRDANCLRSPARRAA